MTVNAYPHHSWSQIRSFREQLLRPALQQQRLVPWDDLLESAMLSMWKPWESCGKTTRKTINIGKPRENHGKTMNKYEKLGPSTAFVDWMDSLGDIIIKYY